MEKKSINVIRDYDDVNSEAKGDFYSSCSLIVNGKKTLELHGLSTGCGIGQCVGFYRLADLTDDEFEQLKEYLTEYITDDEIDYKQFRVGAIIGTLGPSNNDKGNNTKTLVEKLGFVKISEYSNWYDSSSGSWRQSLYIFKPKYRTLENK